MILSEHGLHFQKDPGTGKHRCVEWPRLLMLPEGMYEVGGERFHDFALAMTAARSHDLDPDCVCRRCGFDGAEWHHLQSLRPFDERDDAPDCR